MHRIGDLMKDLGFNKDAPLETQKAFIRHLIRVANGASVPTPTTNSNVLPEVNATPGTQLSFDPEILGTATVQRKKA